MRSRACRRAEGERRCSRSRPKRDEPGLVEAARLLGAPLTSLPLDGARRPKPNAFSRRSAPRERASARASVAEAAALAGAGAGGRLLVPRLAADGATCAIALSADSAHDRAFHRRRAGAPDLITLRGRDLIARCPVCLYAGSLVPKALLDHCPPGARIVDTAPLMLDEIVARCVEAHAAGKDVARLHSGDLSIWSAMGEQLRRLERLGIPYTITPGVPAFAAAAAALQARTDAARSRAVAGADPHRPAAPRRCPSAKRSPPSPPPARRLRSISRSMRSSSVVAELTPFYGPDCPVAIVVARLVARRADRARDARRPRRAPARARSSAPRYPCRPGARRRDFRESELYNADYVRRFRGGSGRDENE